MDEGIRARADKGEYDDIRQGKEPARALTAHLQEVSHDKHLVVSYSPHMLPKRTPAEQTADEREKRNRRAAAVNFGLKKVERLDGNIGYLELQGFWRPGEAGDTVAASMTFLANTDALIIDLRSNGGGNPEKGALPSSYFFSEEPGHLCDPYSPTEKKARPGWGPPSRPRKRHAGKEG